MNGRMPDRTFRSPIVVAVVRGVIWMRSAGVHSTEQGVAIWQTLIVASKEFDLRNVIRDYDRMGQLPPDRHWTILLIPGTVEIDQSQIIGAMDRDGIAPHAAAMSEDKRRTKPK